MLLTTQLAQLEMVMRENQYHNQTCLSDNELVTLSIVVNSLFDFVIDRILIDFDLQISLEQIELEYQTNVRQLENREPMLMETKLHEVQRILDVAIEWWNQKFNYLQMMLSEERSKYFALQREMQKYAYSP